MITSDRDVYLGAHTTAGVKQQLLDEALRQGRSVSQLTHLAIQAYLTTPCLRTFTGKWVNPLALEPDDICIEDIAHALALTNRFGGHSKFPLNVAQHSVGVSLLCPGCPLSALLHDASEAYLGDIPRPLKHSEAFSAYRVIEARVQRAVMLRFSLSEDADLAPQIREADNVMLRLEARTFDPPYKIGERLRPEEVEGLGEWVFRDWVHSEILFLNRFKELTGA